MIPSSAKDLIRRFYRRLGYALRGLAPGTPYPGWPDDRYQALRAVIEHASVNAWQRRLLVVGAGSGFAAPLLAAAGADSITLIESDPASLNYARRTYAAPGVRCLGGDEWQEALSVPAFDRILYFPETAAPSVLVSSTSAREARRTRHGEEPDAFVESRDAADLIDRLADLMAPGAELLVYSTACRTESKTIGERQGLSAGDDLRTGGEFPNGVSGEAADWVEQLDRSFFIVRTMSQRTPVDYRPDQSGLTPATARSTEYSFVRSDEQPPAGTRESGRLLIASTPRKDLPSPPFRVQIGSGAQALEGWLNIDLRPFDGVDVVCDVTDNIRFAPAEAFFAEHFLEHLTLEEALCFLATVHASLIEDGWLRLSTPNLDWSIDDYLGGSDDEERAERTLRLNLGFYGWSHRFLWNRTLLAGALEASGFRNLRWPSYGESELPLFRNLERHPPSPDRPEVPHVLIVEAQRGERSAAELDAFAEHTREVFGRHCAGF